MGILPGGIESRKLEHLTPRKDDGFYRISQCRFRTNGDAVKANSPSTRLTRNLHIEMCVLLQKFSYLYGKSQFQI